MSLFNTFNLTYKRDSASGYINGEWVESEAAAVPFSCSWQPLNGEEQQNLPEGKREKIAYKGYTSTRLYTADQSNTSQADRIVFDGDDYEVISVQPWQNGIISHYKFVAVKEKE